LKFDLQVNPSPNVVVKGYLLKIALYEGLELPEIDKYSKFAIVAACGPYEVCSKFVKNKSSRALWNEYIELSIRAPESIDDIPDVILYLVGDA
jgi:hypothetical protein